MTNPFYVAQPIADISGTITVTIVATGSSDLGSLNLTLDYNPAQGSYGSFTPAVGWSPAVNSSTPGTLSIGEFGLTGIATTADAVAGTVTFTPAAGATDFGFSVVVTDWGDENGNDFPGNISLGTYDVAVPCFVRGTRIATPSGPTPVECLAVGDPVLTASGDNERIVWAGRRHVDCRRHPRPEQVWPVRVAAAALGPDRPSRDLWLSPNHAVLMGNVLIPIKYLINEQTIRQVDCTDVTYYHVELPRHSVIFAEGQPSESFIDVGNRADFGGGASISLFPDFEGCAQDIAAVWEVRGCAPLVVWGTELDKARAIVAKQAANFTADYYNGDDAQSGT